MILVSIVVAGLLGIGTAGAFSVAALISFDASWRAATSGAADPVLGVLAFFSFAMAGLSLLVTMGVVVLVTHQDSR